MNCTATTRLTAEECLASLAACPALPRGERLEWACESPSLFNRARRHRLKPFFIRQALWGMVSTVGSIAAPLSSGRHILEWWRELAAPVRRLRGERRALRARVRELEEHVAAGLWACGGEP